jgi:hypothetical protein
MLISNPDSSGQFSRIQFPWSWWWFPFIKRLTFTYKKPLNRYKKKGKEKRTRSSFLSKRELEKRGRITSFTQNFKPVARPEPCPLAFSQNPTKTLHVTTWNLLTLLVIATVTTIFYPQHDTLPPLTSLNTYPNQPHLPRTTSCTFNESGSDIFWAFPNLLDYSSSRSTFNKYGTVASLFISQRLNRRQWLFGFVTMTAGSREQEVIDKLNGIWFGSFKLHANIQSYHKESKASSSRSLPNPRVPSVSVPIRYRDTRSYPVVVCTANGTYGDLAIPKMKSSQTLCHWLLVILTRGRFYG